MLLWHFPGLESPGKARLVLKKDYWSWKVLEIMQVKNMKCMEDSKDNNFLNVNFRVLEKSWKFVS